MVGAVTTVLAATYVTPAGSGSPTVTTVCVTELMLVTTIVYVIVSPASINPPPFEVLVIRRGIGCGTIVTVDVSLPLTKSGWSRAVNAMRFVIVHPAVLVFTDA